MDVLGVIPARGGSKGIRRKNVRVVDGEPLLAYAIRAAAQSTRVEHVIVSTDDPEIAELAETLDCPVHRRPAELGADHTPMSTVTLDALSAAEGGRGRAYDAIVLLQPTAPLRRGSDIDAAITLLDENSDADSAISVCRVEDFHPARMYRVEGERWMHPLWPKWEEVQRQDLPPLYHRNGAIYVVRRSTLVRDNRIIGRRPVAYIMPAEWSANIDDERDLLIADALARHWKQTS